LIEGSRGFSNGSSGVTIRTLNESWIVISILLYFLVRGCAAESRVGRGFGVGGRGKQEVKGRATIDGIARLKGLS
jgi:hypothetical protein